MGKTAGSDHLSTSEVQEFASANDPVLRAKVKGDSFERIRIEADGTIVTGNGTVTPATDVGSGASGPSPVVAAFSHSTALDTFVPVVDVVAGDLLYITQFTDVIWDQTTYLEVGGSAVDVSGIALFSLLNPSDDDGVLMDEKNDQICRAMVSTTLGYKVSPADAMAPPTTGHGYLYVVIQRPA